MFYKNPAITSIPNCYQKEIFLTFDDGPFPGCTEDVLDLLCSYQIQTTFFLVAQRAMEYSFLTKKIINQNHSLGNHSWDHRYGHFFRGKNHLKNWILKSQKCFIENFNYQPVGFRSPAGVITPPLLEALKEIEMPLIHWRFRFYDTRFWWSQDKAQKVIESLSCGNIILLHDTHINEKKKVFLSTLEFFIQQSLKRGFSFASIKV